MNELAQNIIVLKTLSEDLTIQLSDIIKTDIELFHEDDIEAIAELQGYKKKKIKKLKEKIDKINKEYTHIEELNK